MSSTLTVSRTPELGLGVEFTFDPSGGPLAVTGALTASTRAADSAIGHQSIVNFSDVDGVQKAYLILKRNQLTDSDAPELEMNILMEVKDGSNNVIQTQSNTLTMISLEEPKLNITKIIGGDNMLTISATHTNPDNSIIDISLSKFRVMVSGEGGAAYVGIDSVDITNNAYVIKTNIEAEKMVNDVTLDVWVQATSQSGHQTNLDGVAGFIAKPTNAPSDVTDLYVTSLSYNAGENPVSLNGNWTDLSPGINTTFQIQYGRVTAPGPDQAFFVGGSSTVDVSTNVDGSGNFSFDIGHNIFNLVDMSDTILLGVTVIQRNSLNNDVRRSGMVTVQAHRPVAASVELAVADATVLDVSNQSFVTTVTASHKDSISLFSTFGDAINNNLDPLSPGVLPNTFTTTEQLNVNVARTALQMTLTQSDPNTSGVPLLDDRIAYSSVISTFYVISPVQQNLTVQQPAVDAAPAASLTGGDLNDWDVSTNTVNVYDASSTNLSASFAIDSSFTALTTEDFYTSGNSYNAALTSVYSYTGNHAGYSALDDLTIVSDRTDSIVYYNTPVKAIVTLVGGGVSQPPTATITTPSSFTYPWTQVSQTAKVHDASNNNEAFEGDISGSEPTLMGPSESYIAGRMYFAQVTTVYSNDLGAANATVVSNTTSNQLYYENPTINSITPDASGNIITVEGNSNGATISANALTLFVITDRGDNRDALEYRTIQSTELSVDNGTFTKELQIPDGLTLTSNVNNNFRGVAILDSDNASSVFVTIQSSE